MKAARDPELLAEAKRARRPIDPVAGTVLQDLYKDIFDIPPDERKAITKLFMGK